MADLNIRQDSQVLDDLGISGLRRAYNKKQNILDEKTIEKDPFILFKQWLQEAIQNPNISEPNAMCLATADKKGVPSARFVLLKSFSHQGFIFFTNYGSRKAKELEDNPIAALVFYWEALSKSIRIEGSVKKVSEEESDAYFAERPLANKIGAMCSKQSTKIPSREVLEKRRDELESMLSNESIVTRPDYWGGYVIVPEKFEFWQGQSDRLHDRIIFRKKIDNEEPDGNLTHPAVSDWVMERLSP